MCVPFFSSSFFSWGHSLREKMNYERRHKLVLLLHYYKQLPTASQDEKNSINSSFSFLVSRVFLF